MRIAIIASARHPIREPFAGGLEMHTYFLAQGLRARGHELTVYASAESDPALGLEPVCSPGARLNVSPAAESDPSMPALAFMEEHHAYLRLMLALADSDFDVVQNCALHVGGGSTPAPLHHAPLRHAGLRDRMTLIADWVRCRRPALAVVDVSVEVALLFRLCGVPVVYVRQHGRRDDAPHALAYDCATSLLAPYPAFLEDPWVPAALRYRTFYAGGFSRYDGQLCSSAPRPAGARRVVLVMNGAGGEVLSFEQIGGAARAAPEWDWVRLGGAERETVDEPNLRCESWTGDPLPHSVPPTW